MSDRRPALIVRCLGVADVVASVQFARQHELLLSIKGGGHNIAGLATADGALMLDMSLMRGVFVDPGRQVARAQTGCLLADVDRETQLHGLAAVLGFVSQTGAAGLTLGGGGNFGVVTAIDYRLHPLGPDVVGGVVAWPASEAPAVLDLYRKLSESSGPELTLVALLRPAPPVPWLPKAVHGTPIVAILAWYGGSADDGEAAVAPIKAFGGDQGGLGSTERLSYQQEHRAVTGVNA